MTRVITMFPPYVRSIRSFLGEASYPFMEPGEYVGGASHDEPEQAGSSVWSWEAYLRGPFARTIPTQVETGPEDRVRIHALDLGMSCIDYVWTTDYHETIR